MSNITSLTTKTRNTSSWRRRISTVSSLRIWVPSRFPDGPTTSARGAWYSQRSVIRSTPCGIRNTWRFRSGRSDGCSRTCESPTQDVEVGGLEFRSLNGLNRDKLRFSSPFTLPTSDLEKGYAWTQYVYLPGRGFRPACHSARTAAVSSACPAHLLCLRHHRCRVFQTTHWRQRHLLSIDPWHCGAFSFRWSGS